MILMMTNNNYYNLDNPTAYGGVKGYSKTWLAEQPTYTLHKPPRYKFKRNKFFSKGINDFWQADLADMSKLAKYNSGYKYLLFVIDVFSKFLWVFPLKSKKPEGVLEAFKIIGKLPNLLMTDKGTEFQNAKATDYFKHIKYYTSNSPDTKASVAERVIRTIKTKLYRYFTHQGTYRYIDVLQKFVKGYNESVHRSIGMAPSSVTTADEIRIRNKLYKKRNVGKKPKYKVGDKVRTVKARGIFEKGYLPKWSEEIFEISEVLKRNPIVYKIIDFHGEKIVGVYYESELQKVAPVYRIERIVKRRNNRALVKWLGYPTPTWEPLSNVL